MFKKESIVTNSKIQEKALMDKIDFMHIYFKILINLFCIIWLRWTALFPSFLVLKITKKERKLAIEKRKYHQWCTFVMI